MGLNTTMANREVCDLIFVDYTTKKPFLNLDFLLADFRNCV